MKMQERLGIPTQHQFLATAGGRPLRGGPCSLYDQGVRQYDTLQMCVRMRGGQPVKVSGGLPGARPRREQELDQPDGDQVEGLQDALRGCTNAYSRAQLSVRGCVSVCGVGHRQYEPVTGTSKHD